MSMKLELQPFVDDRLSRLNSRKDGQLSMATQQSWLKELGAAQAEPVSGIAGMNRFQMGGNKLKVFPFIQAIGPDFPKPVQREGHHEKEMPPTDLITGYAQPVFSPVPYLMSSMTEHSAVEIGASDTCGQNSVAHIEDTPVPSREQQVIPAARTSLPSQSYESGVSEQEQPVAQTEVKQVFGGASFNVLVGDYRGTVEVPDANRSIPVRDSEQAVVNPQVCSDGVFIKPFANNLELVEPEHRMEKLVFPPAVQKQIAHTPVRVYAEWHGNEVKVWIGFDKKTHLQTEQVARQLMDWLGEQGISLYSLVCNGRQILASNEGLDASGKRRSVMDEAPDIGRGFTDLWVAEGVSSGFRQEFDKATRQGQG